MEFNEMVLVLPTKRTKAFIGTINGMSYYVQSRNGKADRAKGYLINDAFYLDGDFVKVGDAIKVFINSKPVEYTLNAINCDKNYIQLDNLVIPPECLYFDEKINGMSIDFGCVYDDKEAVVKGVKIDFHPTTDNSKMDEASYTKGWLDAIRDVAEACVDEDSPLHTAMKNLGFEDFAQLYNESQFTLLDLFNERNEAIQDMINNIPQLTHEQIKEQLGYDFKLKD